MVVQKKYEHSYTAKPKEVHDDSWSNSSPPSKIHDQKVVNQEKGMGGNFFLGLYVKSPDPNEFSPGARTKSPGKKAKHMEYL